MYNSRPIEKVSGPLGGEMPTGIKVMLRISKDQQLLLALLGKHPSNILWRGDSSGKLYKVTWRGKELICPHHQLKIWAEIRSHFPILGEYSPYTCLKCRLSLEHTFPCWKFIAYLFWMCTWLTHTHPFIPIFYLFYFRHAIYNNYNSNNRALCRKHSNIIVATRFSFPPPLSQYPL